MKKKQQNDVLWIYTRFTTFGIKEKPKVVEGLQAKINGKTWQICECNKGSDRTKYGHEKYYLTNTKRDHLSFHQTIESAKSMANKGGYDNILE